MSPVFNSESGFKPMTLKGGVFLTVESIGETAYNAYAEALKWKTEDGEPMAPFTHLPAAIQDVWEAVGEAVADYLEKN